MKILIGRTLMEIPQTVNSYFFQKTQFLNCSIKILIILKLAVGFLNMNFLMFN